MAPTYRDPVGGDVRVVPTELAEQYDARGWEQVAADAPAETPAPPADPRPAKNAKVEDWRAYAINERGMASHEAGALTKDELIAAVG